MDSLSYRDLQKLCVEKKKSGDLPKEVKCSSSRKDLLELLAPPEVISSPPRSKSPPPKVNKDQSEGPYDRLYRHLAPYLNLDKLFDLLAYYPQGNLIQEVKDPQGKIWKDRVFVELGEAPVEVGRQGARYYHLYTTRALGPWGEPLIGGKNNSWALVNILVRHFQYYELTNKEEEGNVIYGQAWAIHPRGLGVGLFRIGMKPKVDKIKEALEEENWIFPGGNYKYVTAWSSNHAIAIDYAGKVYHLGIQYSRKGVMKIKKIHSTLLEDIPPLRYLRIVNAYGDRLFFGITALGKHILFHGEGKDNIPAKLITTAVIRSKPPSSKQTGLVGDESVGFEALTINPIDSDRQWLAKLTTEVYELRSLELPGMAPEEVYVLPVPETSETQGDNAFRYAAHSLGHYLDLKGNAHWITVRYYRGDYETYEKIIEAPYRLFWYGKYSYWWYGLAW